MKLINEFNNLELIFDDELLDKLGVLGKKHYPNEYGGFLTGYYSENFDKLFLDDFVLPHKYKGIPCLFERSIDGMKDYFINLFDKKKQYYVGEWHTHPNGSSMYSQTDLDAMKQIEACETVNIKNPILLILSINTECINDFSFYLYNKGELIKYE